MTLREISTKAEAINRIVAGVSALAALDGVTVSSVPLSLSDKVSKSLEFVDARGTQGERLTGKRRQNETYRINGYSWVTAYGYSESVFSGARDEAVRIVGELDLWLRADKTLGGIARSAQLASGDLRQLIDADGNRVVVADFAIEINADFLKEA